MSCTEPHFRLALAIVAAAALSCPLSALADDEGSEHTAQLGGAEADTLGVQVRFAEPGTSPAMWSMDFRARPGAPTQHLELPFLPTTHAHYQVMVAPGRRSVTFVLQSTETLSLDSEVVWVVDRNGTLRATLRLEHFMDNEGLATLERSISHVQWLRTPAAMTNKGIELRTVQRRYVLDPIARKLRVAR